MEIWKLNTEKWEGKHRDMVGKHGDMGGKHGAMGLETWRYGKGIMENGFMKEKM